MVDVGCKRLGLFFNLGIMISSAEYNYTNLIASVCEGIFVEKTWTVGKYITDDLCIDSPNAQMVFVGIVFLLQKQRTCDRNKIAGITPAQ